MKNLEAVYFILNEMVMNGNIVETNKQNVMAPIMLCDKYVPFTAPPRVHVPGPPRLLHRPAWVSATLDLQ